MAKFLNTTKTNSYLEDLIKESKERLFLISPYLRFNDRIKELLTDANRMKIDIRLVYGKSELPPKETNWLNSLEFVRTSFCQNLHAKCYLNEKAAIVTSMNLYEFSQVNNNEMGVFVERETDSELYSQILEEAQRFIRISEQVRLAADPVVEKEEAISEVKEESENGYEKLTTSKLAKTLGMSTAELNQKLVDGGFFIMESDKPRLSDTAKAAGGEFRYNRQRIPYFLWPKDFRP